MLLKKRSAIVSAFNALTARLVEEAGFNGVWISGFEASALRCLPDNGTITMTEVVEVVRSITSAVNVPVIVDCDEGYGGLHNAKRMAKEMQSAGADVICIEDNLFPKKHSFWSKGQEIATKEAHGMKIRAIKDCSHLQVIGRTEALIRGLGIDEALIRAYHYQKCGADYILIHSRDESGEEAIDIAKHIKDFDIPFIIVPTKFPHMTTQELFNLGYYSVIWANHTLRLSLKAVRCGLKALKESDNAKSIEDSLGSLEDIYTLTNVEQMERDEDDYK